MRTLSLAGIYMAPVVVFTAALTLSDFPSELVDYSEFEGQSVIAELIEFDGDKVLDLATKKSGDRGTKASTTYVSVASNKSSVAAQEVSSVLDRDTFFGIQDLSVEAISAEFDDLIKAADLRPGFAITAAAHQAIVGANSASKSTPLTRTVQRAASRAPLGVARFGGSGGGSGSAAATAFASASGIPSPTAPGSAAPFGLPSATGLLPVTSGLSTVPLPASSLLLLAAIALFGAFKLRRQA